MLGTIFKYLSVPLIILLGIPATLIMISQNSIPGDTVYPIKRQMEDILATVLQVSPKAYADYSITLADNRFEEAQSLVLRSGSTQGLDELVTQVVAAEENIEELSDEPAQDELLAKLVAQIETYEVGLESTLLQSTPAPTTTTTTTQPTPTPTPSPDLPVPPGDTTLQPSPSPISTTPQPTPTPPPPIIEQPIATPQPITTQPRTITPDVSSLTQNIEEAKMKLRNVRERAHARRQQRRKKHQEQRGRSKQQKQKKQEGRRNDREESEEKRRD